MNHRYCQAEAYKTSRERPQRRIAHGVQTKRSDAYYDSIFIGNFFLSENCVLDQLFQYWVFNFLSAISGTCSAVFFSNEIRQTLDCLDCLPFSRNVCRQMFQHLLLSSEKFELVTRCVNTFSRCVNTFTYPYKKVFPLNDEQGVGVCSTAKILTRSMLCNTVCESNVQVVLKLPVPARRPLIAVNHSRYWHAKSSSFF